MYRTKAACAGRGRRRPSLSTQQTAADGRAFLEQCLARMSLGDKDALAEFYEKTRDALYGFILAIVKNQQDAEDVLQDTYLRIYGAAGGYQATGSPMPWVFTIARNLALMRLRYRRYPAFVRASERRHEVYNASLAYADQAQAEGRALVLCPSRRVPIGRVEKNPEVLEAQYRLGRADARAARERIEGFLGAK